MSIISFFPHFLPLTHPYQTNYFPSSILISTSFYLWASERATSTCWEKWESQNFFFSLSTFHSLSRSNSNSIKAYKFKRKKKLITLECRHHFDEGFIDKFPLIRSTVIKSRHLTYPIIIPIPNVMMKMRIAISRTP